MTENRIRKTVSISPPGTLTKEDWKKFVNNIIWFTFPIYGFAFFGQLAAGIPAKTAALTSMAALWGPLRDLFKKWQEETIWL